MRISIFGGTGFVGSHLIQALERSGHSIRLLSRNPATHHALLTFPSVQLRSTPNWQSSELAELIQNSDVAINLIGILNEKGYSGKGFYRAHVETTKAITQACKLAQVNRYLHMSALNAGEGFSHYLKSKGEAEDIVMQAEQEFGLLTTIFQPSVIFGRGDSFINRFAALLSLSPVLPLARPHTRFQPVWVNDVANAFVTTLNKPSSYGQRYPLVGPDTYSLIKIVKIIAHHMHKKRLIIPLPGVVSHIQAQIMDLIPGKPYSTDNDRSLLQDSTSSIDGLKQLSIKPQSLLAIIPDILRYEQTHQIRLNHYRRHAGRR